VRCNRNEQTQASVKVVAVLRTWGRSVMVRGRYYHSHIASSIRPSAPTIPVAHVATQPLIRVRRLRVMQQSVAKHRGGLQTTRPSEPSNKPYQRQLQQKPGLSLHRQVSSKVRASMLCSLPFSRHICPRAARCAGKPGGRFSSSATSRLIALKLHH